ncbi:DUF1266 domain-containing protein [Microbacterium sp. Leaf320]|uniref:DUF1266 domain-containing protein n=1 Tax=Microbacterium sp. Leaf320 TaxID=1736334 RepID=UPI0006FEE012|nr:DUF1266 domain-containing protein [Microbacterium sp. Leaf320]KQQ66697.1 hypothetical protein ASF63_05290 [Microbacterium sp. Leaf320]
MHPLSWILPASRFPASSEYATSDAAANEIALGFLQIRAVPSGAWNDPTASELGDDEKQALIDQWGIHSRQDWLGMIEHLTTVRRRRHAWMLHLAVRNDLATRLGRAPRTREWLDAIAADGGDARDAHPFVAGIEHIERELRRRVGDDIVTSDVYVRTLDAYALGQAVALTTWGVALGYSDLAEARRIIHRINVDARPCFVSWADFGLSYLAGRIMHWSDGTLDEDSFAKYGGGWHDFKEAASAKRHGPWATLPWPAPIELRSPHPIG